MFSLVRLRRGLGLVGNAIKQQSAGFRQLCKTHPEMTAVDFIQRCRIGEEIPGAEFAEEEKSRAFKEFLHFIRECGGKFV